MPLLAKAPEATRNIMKRAYSQSRFSAPGDGDLRLIDPEAAAAIVNRFNARLTPRTSLECSSTTSISNTISTRRRAPTDG
jgi:hypothetical protein